MAEISVIIPVYNEIKFIQKTLESVVGDADEIILSDNASTDGTSDICQDFANKYHEIKYTRHKENMGSAKNFLFAADRASGKYIRSIGAHDMSSIGSNRRMASLLDNNPDVVMVYPKHIIGLKNDYSFNYFHDFSEFGNDLMSDQASIRIGSMITNLREFSIFFGLWRRDVFMNCINTRIFQSVATDHTILSTTAAKGKMLADDKSIFFRMYQYDEKKINNKENRFVKAIFGQENENIHDGYYYFAIIAEQYEMLIELFGKNSSITAELFDFLLSRFSFEFDESESILDNLPPIIPGKKEFCQEIIASIKQKHTENKKSNNKRSGSVKFRNGIKKIFKYVLPYGLYAGLKLIYKKIGECVKKQKRLKEIKNRKYIYLYAGDVPLNNHHYMNDILGLSLTQNDDKHIKHNIIYKHPFAGNSVDIYQAEDVFEHIDYAKLGFVIQDIYRILKPNGLFRLSVPDYRCDILSGRCIKDKGGDIIFDPHGGGSFIEKTKKVNYGGHVWFPKYEAVKKLLEKIPFSKVEFLHYYDENGKPHCSKIDYSKGHIKRTPDHDDRVNNPYRPMSIVVDCYK